MFYIDRSGFLSPSPRIETSSSSSPSPSPLPFPRLTLLTLARLDRQTERSDRVTSFFLFDGFQAPPLLAPHSPFALRERVRDADKETGEEGTDREREEKKTHAGFLFRFGSFKVPSAYSFAYLLRVTNGKSARGGTRGF